MTDKNPKDMTLQEQRDYVMSVIKDRVERHFVGQTATEGTADEMRRVLTDALSMVSDAFPRPREGDIRLLAELAALSFGLCKGVDVRTVCGTLSDEGIEHFLRLYGGISEVSGPAAFILLEQHRRKGRITDWSFEWSTSNPREGEITLYPNKPVEMMTAYVVVPTE